jgi:hypothetical protein
MGKKETIGKKVARPFIRFGQLLDLGWLISFKGASIDDITIKAFNGENDNMGSDIIIHGYEAIQNRGADGVLDIAYDARKEPGVSRVEINVPQRRGNEMCHQIVIR